jgi:hypothetical protein
MRHPQADCIHIMDRIRGKKHRLGVNVRIQDALLVLFATFFIVSMPGCGSDGGGNDASSNGQNHLVSGNLSSTTNSENPLIGTWLSGEHSLTFNSDNTYLGDLNHDGIPEVWGSVMVSGNVVIFTDAVGSNSRRLKDSGQIVSGSYTYAISGNTLIFSRVHDLCHNRANLLCLDYQKK